MVLMLLLIYLIFMGYLGTLLYLRSLLCSSRVIFGYRRHILGLMNKLFRVGLVIIYLLIEV